MCVCRGRLVSSAAVADRVHTHMCTATVFSAYRARACKLTDFGLQMSAPRPTPTHPHTACSRQRDGGAGTPPRLRPALEGPGKHHTRGLRDGGGSRRARARALRGASRRASRGAPRGDTARSTASWESAGRPCGAALSEGHGGGPSAGQPPCVAPVWNMWRASRVQEASLVRERGRGMKAPLQGLGFLWAGAHGLGGLGGEEGAPGGHQKEREREGV